MLTQLIWSSLIGIIAIVLLGSILLTVVVGIVIIGERQVGIVIKKFSRFNLPAGRLIALNGEAGYQADTLSPGLHFGFPRWMYTIKKIPVVQIPPNEIGLLVAADGATIPAHRILGKVVDCKDFQDARAFLENGGEKGRQLGILTTGTYRINTALFTVIASQNAHQFGIDPEELKVYRVQPDMVGMVTTLDGYSIPEGEIAGPVIQGHNSFQDAQIFIRNEGSRGLQEQILLSGSWNLNPWFVDVEQVPMTEIPIGYVGVVISYVGRAHEDVSGVEFKHGDLVKQGYKGVWVDPLYPGKHPLNTRVMGVELVPTTNIVLNWASRTEAHQYDNNLSSITVRSKDGFAFNLDVSQIIHVGALDAPKVISRVGSMQNLVDHVLQPIVGNYFRNAAQYYTVLDFLTDRSNRQREAAEHIRAALALYDVQAIDTLIGDITPPEELMLTQTDRKIAEEQRKTYAVQEEAQTQRQQLVRQTALADIQQDMVEAEQGVDIADLKAKAEIKKATGDAEATRLKAEGDAEAIRTKGKAQAEAYQAGIEAMGEEGFTAVQIMGLVGKHGVRVVPDVSVSSSNGAGLGESLLGLLVHDHSKTNGKSEGKKA